MSKSKAGAVLRQGDVLLVRVPGSAVPDDVKAADPAEEVVLAEGEVTGHRHVFNPRMDDAKVESLLGRGLHFVRVSEGTAKLRHGSLGGGYKDGDHETLDVPPGTYKVVKQVEYRYGESSRVQD